MKMMAAGAVLLFTIGHGQCADLTLVCNVVEATPAYRTSFQKRYDFYWDTQKVQSFDRPQTGGIWRLTDSRSIQRLDDAVIVIKDDGLVLNYIDRLTGTYYFRNPPENTLTRGSCRPATAPSGLF